MRLDGARILDHQLPYVNSVLSFLARGHRPLGAKVRDRERERVIESDILDYQLPYVDSVLSFLARGHRPLGTKVKDRE